MAGASKTSKKAMAAASGSKTAAQQSGEGSTLVPLNSGRHVYLRHPGTKQTLHLATASEQFVEVVAEVAAGGQAGKIRAELQELDGRFPEHGWGDTLSRLEAAGALPA